MLYSQEQLTTIANVFTALDFVACHQQGEYELRVTKVKRKVRATSPNLGLVVGNVVTAANITLTTVKTFVYVEIVAVKPRNIKYHSGQVIDSFTFEL